MRRSSYFLVKNVFVEEKEEEEFGGSLIFKNNISKLTSKTL